MSEKRATAPEASKRRITMERTYDAASLDDVWDLWTTKDGIESWWGPEGFTVKVRTLDLDAMHAEEWTERAAAGWTEELGKLARALAA